MNKEQFTEKVLAMERSLYCVARTILQNDEDCADAMQDAILSAYRKLDTLKEERYFKTWLTRILINECYTQLRSRKNQISYEEYMKTGEREGTAFNLKDLSGITRIYETDMEIVLADVPVIVNKVVITPMNIAVYYDVDVDKFCAEGLLDDALEGLPDDRQFYSAMKMCGSICNNRNAPLVITEY